MYSSILAEVKNLEAKHHNQWVVERGLDVRWVYANARSVNQHEATRLLGYTAKSGGVWLEGANRQGQFRPDKPWLAEQDKQQGSKKAPKYRTPAGGGYDVILVNNPDIKNYWQDLKDKCYNLDGHPCLVLTEGVAKAIAGCSNDIPTVALLGVEMGLTSAEDDPQGKRYLVQGLEQLATAGFGFVFAFDADALHNRAVGMAQLKLAKQLSRFKIPLYSATGLWKESEGKGMDDYIQRYGADKFRYDVLANAETIERWEKQFQSAWDDLEPKSKKLSANRVAHQLAEKYSNKLAWNVEARTWCRYEAEQQGVWTREPDEAIEQVVGAELEALGLEYSYRYLTDVIRLMRSLLLVKKWNQVKGLIPLTNGVLDKKTLKLRKHSPTHKLTYCLPFAYDPVATCEPIAEWLHESVGGKEDVVRLLLAYLNAIVNQRSDLQRFLELVGYGGSGKSTYIRLAQSLVGHENTVSTSHKVLEESRFETANLYGKLLAVITESDKYTGSISVLKALTGQDALRYEQKMKQSGAGFTYEGMVIIAANETPQSSDYTSGLRRRRISVPFKNVVHPSRARDLDSEFKQYLPGLLNLVLSIPDTEVQQMVKQTETYCPSLAQHQLETLCETNPVADWINNSITYEQGNRHTPSFLYEHYKDYCLKGGVTPVSQKRYGNLLEDLCKAQLHWDGFERGRDRNGRYIIGLKLRHSEDFSTPLSITDAPLTQTGVTHQPVTRDASVTARTYVVYGCDGCDAFLTNSTQSNEVLHHIEVKDALRKTLENDPQSVTPVTESKEKIGEKLATQGRDGYEPKIANVAKPVTPFPYIGSKVGKLNEYGQRRSGWVGVIRSIDGDKAEVWWSGDYETNRNGKVIRNANATPREKLTTESLHLLVEWK